jgi:hypothetical protein
LFAPQSALVAICAPHASTTFFVPVEPVTVNITLIDVVLSPE